MTVDELIYELTKMSQKGLGNTQVSKYKNHKIKANKVIYGTYRDGLTVDNFVMIVFGSLKPEDRGMFNQ